MRGSIYIRVRISLRTHLLFIALLAVFACPSLFAYPPQKSTDLATQSIEDLMNIQVTSVSKKEEKLSRTAAAVFVITQEDIRRSGAANIPDLLRMVPGMDVGQIDSNTWAISARGLNEEFSNKLMVMVDGRSVYTPTFAGVFWETFDIPLEDIERIEVIRGPGGTQWGSNAVNGVVNVITKKASETKGGMAVAGGGTLNRGFGTLQYGEQFRKSTDFRVFAKYLDQSPLPSLVGQSGGDGWNMLRGGFRADTAISQEDDVTVQGDLYTGREGEAVLPFGAFVGVPMVASMGGGYLQAVWNHTYAAGSNTTLQISDDRYERNLPFRDARNTVDVDFQHRFVWAGRHDIVWGASYRYTNHRSNSAHIHYDASDNIRQIFGSFVQDEIAVRPNRLYLTLGVRLEHNEYTGLVALPNVRLSWQPSTRHALWAAVSSAKRTPSSGDVADHIQGAEAPGPGGIPTLIVLSGNPNFQNERLLAYEAGYRASLSENLALDFSAYYNSYDSLRTVEPQTPFLETTASSPVLVLPYEFRNEMYGETHGLEVSANWKVASRWALSPGYAFELVDLHLAPASQDDTLFPVAEGGSPEHSAQIRSHVDLGHELSWNASAYFVGRLPGLTTPSYTRVDTGLTWSLTERTSFAIVGQNLVKDHRLEYLESAGLVQSGQVKRGVYGKFTVEF